MISPMKIDPGSKSPQVRGYIADKNLLFGQSDWCEIIVVPKVDGVDGCR